MLLYFLIIIPTLFAAFLLFSYWQERNYRHKPYYKLADVGWRLTTLPPDSEKVYSVAMLGDVGAVATDGSDPVLAIFREWQEKHTAAGIAVFLGDNLYPVGLPPEEHRHRALAETRLRTILQQLQDFKTRCIFLSGNHDWNKGRPDGYQYMLRQEKYIVDALQNQETYLPPHGCPGPVTLQLSDGLLLIVINTQWWVQRGEKPLGSKYNCPYTDIEEFYIDLNNLLRKNRHQRIIIAAHHPLYSNALHGGKFTVKQHLFPLTAANNRYLIPLPILGSLYPFYRKFFGAYEDMSHKTYKRMRKRLLQIFHRYQNIIYVAGHDHNLQHFEKRGNHYLVSGSGSKTSFVKKGGSATFTLEQPGFAVLNYYQNGEVWLEMHVVPIETDTEHFEGEAFMVTIANANAFGSNATINPTGILNDGRFEICLIERFPKAAGIGILYKLYTDSIDDSVYTRKLTCRSATIHNTDKEVMHIDGEPVEPGNEVRVKIKPKSLKVILPVPEPDQA